MAQEPDVPFDSHMIDRHVGQRICERRLTLGMSQERLGLALGVSYQQVQKYELGINRLSAGRLYQVGRVLGVAMPFFFENLPARAHAANVERDLGPGGEISDRLLIAASTAFRQIPGERTRQCLVLLMRALAEIENERDRSREDVPQCGPRAAD